MRTHVFAALGAVLLVGACGVGFGRVGLTAGMAAAASLMGNVMGFSVVGLLITLVLLGQCVLSGFLRDRLR